MGSNLNQALFVQLLFFQTVHSFVCTLYLIFLVLVINSTMGEFCCLKYFFDFLFLFLFCFICLFVVVDFFITSVKSPIKNVTSRIEGCDDEPSYVAIQFLLCLWRSTIGIKYPELSNPGNEGRAVPT